MIRYILVLLVLSLFIWFVWKTLRSKNITLKPKWLIATGIALGVSLGLVAFNATTHLNMAVSPIPILIYVSISTILFFIDHNSIFKKRLSHAALFLFVSTISHWIPGAIFVLMVLLFGMH